MITFTCARCKVDVGRLWTVLLVTTELKIGEQPDGVNGPSVQLCSACNNLIDEHFVSRIVGYQLPPVETEVEKATNFFVYTIEDVRVKLHEDLNAEEGDVRFYVHIFEPTEDPQALHPVILASGKTAWEAWDAAVDILTAVAGAIRERK